MSDIRLDQLSLKQCDEYLEDAKESRHVKRARAARAITGCSLSDALLWVDKILREKCVVNVHPDFLMEIANEKNWTKGLQLMHDGLTVEINEEVYDYYFGTVPPLKMIENGFIMGEVIQGNNYYCFIHVDGKFYGYMDEIT